MERVNNLHLHMTLKDIAYAICDHKSVKLDRKYIQIEENTSEEAKRWDTGRNMLIITPQEPDDDELDELDAPPSEDEGPGLIKSTKGRRKKKAQSYFQTLQLLQRDLPSVVIKGHSDTNRAIIRSKDTDEGRKEYELLVEGYGLKACMNTDGVHGLQTRTNSVMETAQVLGIEATRGVIESEIKAVMESMEIDGHHIGLLACIMTLRGEVLGITRFGIMKMADSVLQLASFERTPDHLFEAATRMKSDPIAGVSESIIMGQPVKLGTGMAQVVRPLEFERGMFWGGAKESVFETAWNGEVAKGWGNEKEFWIGKKVFGEAVVVDG
jgi:DNA-directed RNA polymerase beta' subunit